MAVTLHPLPAYVKDVAAPKQFTYPFCYEPHPLCVAAANELRQYLSLHPEWHEELSKGKMFGVLVVEGGFLAAFSGTLNGKTQHEYFVPPVFDLMAPGCYFQEEEAAISDINKEIIALQDSVQPSPLRKKMDEELASTGMKPYSKWNNYHRFLNSFILDAIDEGFLKRNPYKWIQIDKEKNNGLKKHLTPEEFNKLQIAKMPTPSLERVRDLFVFQTYTCLSYVDLESFDTSLINKTGVYTSKRGKTGIEFTFYVLKPARDILDKYGGKLPLISNVKYNEYLKLVAQAAGIDKPVTSHWARHTGATILLNDGGVDMEIIARILGHTSTRQTRETYAKMLDTTVTKAMMGFESRIKRSTSE